MSQHDYVLDNQNGASFRADLNSALSAIVTQNMGATAPTTTFAGMWWADTANGWLKQRNATDTAWVSRFNLAADLTVNKTSDTGSVQLPSGTTAQQDGGVGAIRYNSDNDSFEGNYTAGYAAIGASSLIAAGTNQTLIKVNGTPEVTVGVNGIEAGSYAPLSVTPANLSQKLTLATAVNTTSGTSVDFTGIPSWATKVTVVLNGVSTSGTSNLLVQIGSTGVETTGYLSQANTFNAGPSSVVSTAGFLLTGTLLAAAVTNYILTICNISGNVWIASGTGAAAAAANGVSLCAGSKTLAGVLDRIRLTTVNGTDVFDAGSVNIIYEG